MYRSAGKHGLNGVSFDSLAWSIADGVSDWVSNPTNVALIGLANGVSGVGTITSSHLFLPPVIPIVEGGLTSAGITGPVASSLATVVTLALAHVVTQFGGYDGVCPTVSNGVDISKVVLSNPGSLITGLSQSMNNNGINGQSAARLSNGLGLGIAALFLTVTGTGKVVGVAGPSPSTGPSFSKVG